MREFHVSPRPEKRVCSLAGNQVLVYSKFQKNCCVSLDLMYEVISKMITDKLNPWGISQAIAALFCILVYSVVNPSEIVLLRMQFSIILGAKRSEKCNSLLLPVQNITKTYQIFRLIFTEVFINIICKTLKN